MIIPPPPVPMPQEHRTALLLNGAELLSVQSTPADLADWAVGFLFAEGFIGGPGELMRLDIETDAARVHAEVDPTRLEGLDLAGRRYLTSGCGKGVTFSSVRDAMLLRPVSHTLSVRTADLLTWIRQMQRQSPRYAESGGMHAAALVRVETGEMLVREDIGRHNAVDKAIGAALRQNWALSACILLTSGRISYEMAAKLARAQIGVSASLTAATDQAIRLANRLGVDLAGYARSEGKLVIYTAGRRIGPSA